MTDNAALYKALAAAQAMMEPAKKNNVNSHFGNKYADLGAAQEACMPALRKHGFAVFQPFGHDEFGPYVETVFAHESGGTLTSRLHLRLNKNDMQGLGSAISYARRYGLLAMAGIASEDDDGQQAVARPMLQIDGKGVSSGEFKAWLLDDLNACPLDELDAWKAHRKDELNALKAADARMLNDVASRWNMRAKEADAAKEKAA